MPGNINTKDYWDTRFATGDWERKHGRWQTRCFAAGQVGHFRLGRDFAGTLLDFGCGLGDAMPVYRGRFPQAKLIGMDISSAAIEQCRKTYGSIAEFRQGGVAAVPDGVDVIVASNVLEHLDQDLAAAQALLRKCTELYIVVPYREHPLFGEHVRSYDQNRFSELGPGRCVVFPCRGWSAYGRELWVEIYFKNILRRVLGRDLRRRNLQILFHFKRDGGQRS